MHYLLKVTLIGRGGRGGLLYDLLQAADKQQPIAYFAAAVCLCLIIAALVNHALAYKQSRNDPGNSGSPIYSTLQLVATLLLPVLVLYWILSRLMK